MPERPFELATWHQATVHHDSHLTFDKRLYSVPWTLIDQKLWLRATSTSVYVYDAKDEIVATHARIGSTTRSTIAAHLPAEREPWRHRNRAFWEARADAMAPEVGAYVRAVFNSDDVLDLIRVVQAIVMHLEKFPVERAVAACKRALHFAVFTYAVIKNILRDGLDQQPIATTTNQPQLPSPRYARNIDDILHREAHHEHN